MNFIDSKISEDLDAITHSCKQLLLQLKNKNIFITGGTGFMGKWLTQTLLYAGDIFNLNLKVTLLTRNKERFLSEYPFFRNAENLFFLEGDICDFNFPTDKFDNIIHAATDASAKMNVETPLLMSDVILQGTRHLLDFAVHANVKRVLFLSSGAVYGKQPDEIAGFPEDYPGAPDPLLPGAAYSESKRMAEFVCGVYARKYNITIPIARCFAFVGPYLPLDTHFAIGNFIADGLAGRDICITGNGKPQRSYMYASDMVIWLLHIWLQGDSVEAYNVGSDKSVTIRNLANSITCFFPDCDVQVLGEERATDRNQNYVPNVDKAKRKFQLNELIPLNVAIEKTIKYCK